MSRSYIVESVLLLWQDFHLQDKLDLSWRTGLLRFYFLKHAQSPTYRGHIITHKSDNPYLAMIIRLFKVGDSAIRSFPAAAGIYL